MISKALSDLAAHLECAQRTRRHADRSKLWRPSATPATDLGHKCTRRIVYHRTQPEMAEPIGEELASIFTEGNLHQADVRRELSALGYEVAEAEVHFRDETYDITGMIDGKLALDGDRHCRRPLEIKSTTGSPPKTAGALREHDGLYGRYFAQLQVYLLLTGEPEGLFLFKDKISGLWTCVPVALDYDYAEALLRRAEIVRDHVRAKTLPDRLPDRSECATCPWRDTACRPGDAEVDPVLVATDEELAAQLEERESLEPISKTYTKLDKLIKTRFKLTRGDRFVCGDYLIHKKPHGKGIRVCIDRAPLARS